MSDVCGIIFVETTKGHDMSLLGYINAIGFELAKRTNGKVGSYSFGRQRLIDLYDEGYSVNYACDLLLAGKNI